MKKFRIVCAAIAMASVAPAFAGGLLTNTNQNVAFNRMMSREASIGIDGVYYNPAGVVFMGDGHHLSINWQLAYQTRTIENDYALFTNNVNNPITPPFSPICLQQKQMVFPSQLRPHWWRRQVYLRQRTWFFRENRG